MARFGASLGQSFIDAGGRNVTIGLQSRAGTRNTGAIVGMTLFCQFWYWYPLTLCASLAFEPTGIIGLTEELKVTMILFAEWQDANKNTRLPSSTSSLTQDQVSLHTRLRSSRRRRKSPPKSQQRCSRLRSRSAPASARRQRTQARRWRQMRSPRRRRKETSR